MFRKIRFTITFWYISITMILTIFFSYVIYIRSGAVIVHALQVKQISLQRNEHPHSTTMVPITAAEIEAALNQLRIVLIAIDFFVLCMAGAAGYFLAGKTLRPIEKNLEEQRRFVTDAS